LGAPRHAAQLQVFDQALLKWAHGNIRSADNEVAMSTDWRPNTAERRGDA
jgi:hypothetical protein